MSRRSERALERLDPGMAAAVRASAGDGTAAAAVRDREEEVGAVHPGGGLLTSRLKVGEPYYVWTTAFFWVGRLVSVGNDYLELTEASIVTYEGRTSTLHRTGRASNLEVEPVTLPGESVYVALDSVNAVKPWSHPLFREAIP